MLRIYFQTVDAFYFQTAVYHRIHLSNYAYFNTKIDLMPTNCKPFFILCISFSSFLRLSFYQTSWVLLHSKPCTLLFTKEWTNFMINYLAPAAHFSLKYSCQTAWKLSTRTNNTTIWGCHQRTIFEIRLQRIFCHYEFIFGLYNIPTMFLWQIVQIVRSKSA